MTSLALGDILQYHAADDSRSNPALIYPGGSFGWAELDVWADQLAARCAQHGVVHNDLIAIALSNGPEFHAAIFAVWKCGATPAILSPSLPQHELAAVLELAKPKAVIAHDLPVTVNCPHIAPDPPDSTVSPGAKRSILIPTYWKAVCSGGSTGRPKLIIDHMRGEYDVTGSGLHTLLQLEPGSVMLNPGPLYHNGPFLFTSLALFTGCTVVGMKRFDAEECLRLIEAHRVRWVCLVPTMMHRIWALPEEVRGRYDLSSLDAVWHMAAPCPPWLKQAWIEWLGPERIWEAYAGTERFGITVLRGDEWLQRPGSVGRIVGAGKIKAFRDDGTDCVPGEVGELFFFPEGGEPPSHYLGADAHREPTGWYSIGDLGHLDEDGYVYLADRRTDMILRGGANIYPAEIEGALEEHPAVASSIAIGLPCDELGARVHAIVQPKAGHTISLDQIQEFLRSRLAKYKLPESYEFSAEALRDDAGKARRAALRDERIRWREDGRVFVASA